MDNKSVRRVLMTADTVGGVWTYALELSRALAAEGIEVLLATMGAPLQAAQRAAAREIPSLLIEESAYRLEWMDDPWADVDAAGRWLQSLAASYGPDLIHLNGYAHAGLPWSAPVVVVAHSDVLTWWQSVKGETAPPSWSEYRARVEAGLRSAAAVVAPTEAMAEALRKLYRLNEPAHVIYNGVDASVFAEETPKECFVLAAGRLWDEAKNLAALQAVAPDLSWPIYVAGDDRHPNGRDTVAWSAAKPLGVLTPAALRSWYARAEIYAFPARYEPFGLSVLEAALSGCALVLGDIPSLRELWGDTAWYASPNDLDQLRLTLQTLIAHPETRRDLARRSRQRALRYTAERMASEYVELYSGLVWANAYAESVY